MRKGSANSKVDHKCDCAGYYFIYGVLTSYLTAVQGFTPADIVLRFRYTKKWVNDKLGLPKGGLFFFFF